MFFRIILLFPIRVLTKKSNTLSNIRLLTSEPIEIFEWDPSILPVDFVQIHTYHPLRIPNEIWWYSKYVGKPWIIGETALPSDNDSISYDLQARFVKEVYQYIIDCGGIGFGWWEFQDHINPGLNFEANYPGLLNHDGITTTKSGKEIVYAADNPVGSRTEG